MALEKIEGDIREGGIEKEWQQRLYFFDIKFVLFFVPILKQMLPRVTNFHIERLKEWMTLQKLMLSGGTSELDRDGLRYV